MTPLLPVGYTVRPPLPEDLEPLVALLSAASIAEIGVSETTLRELRYDWEDTHRNPALYNRLIVSPDSRLVGYLDFYNHGEGNRFSIEGIVHPDFTGLGLGRYLLRLGEEEAGQLLAPGSSPLILNTFTWGQNIAASTLFISEGYFIERRFWRMEIALDQEPPAPQIPDGLKIRPFIPGDDDLLMYETIEEAFKDHWGYSPQSFAEWKDDHITHNPYYDPTLWFIAVEGDQVAGVLLGRPQRSEDPQAGHIKTLAVARSWRKKGIGLALLHYSFAEFYRRGKKRANLGVDAQNLTGATRLYERAGMKIVREALLYRKEIPL